MIYQRGTVGSYNTWADLVGDSSYEWNNILPFFKKSVAFTPPVLLCRCNGTEGILFVEIVDRSGLPRIG